MTVPSSGTSDFPQNPPPEPTPAVPPTTSALTAARAIRAATEVFVAITGRQPDGVTGARQTAERGWSVLIDVVELERIPATTSVIGTYRVDVDSAGELVSYERIRRFTRGTTDL
ncbi:MULTISPECIES: gas vesicle protein GvpO [unclassified Amycolatopsis]|uniref:gas vesicle protein GvpO n=1 Tax=unclassified Amycolatopsis TaxID=2618356 RepID=UPI002E1EFA81|nr:MULTISPECIES: gas vesicle protein GvpO [unclassified Amycolatopsis]